MMKQIRNQLLFQLRSALPKLRPDSYSERLESSLEQSEIPLSLAQTLSETSLRVSLFYLWMLSQFQIRLQNRHHQIVDIGSKNLFYASAIYCFLKQQNYSGKVYAIEADTKRLYEDYFRRCDYANYFVGCVNREVGFKQFEYHQANWLDFKPHERFDLSICFFPFIFSDLSMGWGLPDKFFKPQDFYRKAAEQSDEVLFFHQGQKELEESKRLIQAIEGSQIIEEKEFRDNPWVKRKHPVFALHWQKLKSSH